MKNSEKGQALPLVLIALALGAMVIPPFLENTGASLISSLTYAEGLSSQYAADSGAEHAIWELKYSDLSGDVPLVGDNTSYTLDEPVNGLAVGVTVTKTGNPSTYSIVSRASGSTLNVSASVNSTDTHIYTWKLE